MELYYGASMQVDSLYLSTASGCDSFATQFVAAERRGQCSAVQCHSWMTPAENCMGMVNRHWQKSGMETTFNGTVHVIVSQRTTCDGV